MLFQIEVFKCSVFLLEYCTTRAKPSVEKSEYLRTLGRALTSNIDVLWTGKLKLYCFYGLLRCFYIFNYMELVAHTHEHLIRILQFQSSAPEGLQTSHS